MSLESEDVYEEEEEEEAIDDLLVVDDDLIAVLRDGIDRSDPLSLAKAVHLICGILEKDETMIIDADLSESPLISLLVPLEERLVEVYSQSKEGSVKREKVLELLELLASKLFNSFDKFQKKKFAPVFVDSIYNLREFVKDKQLRKVTLIVSNIWFETQHEMIIGLFDKMMDQGEKFSSLVLEVVYKQVTSRRNMESLEKVLQIVLDFFCNHVTIVESLIKSLIKRLAAGATDCMAKKDPYIISWDSMGIIQMVTGFLLRCDERKFVFPFVAVLMSLLNNFPVKKNLPFQLLVVKAVHDIERKYDEFASILSWMTDVIQFLVSSSFKGNYSFDWNSELRTPEQMSFDFCRQSLDRLKRVFLAEIVRYSQSIAFPELIMSIKERLDDIIAKSKNKEVAGEVNAMLRTLTQQQNILTELKHNLKWSNSSEQLSVWKSQIQHVETPLPDVFDRESKVEQKLAELKKLTSKRYTDDKTGDILEIATVDDV